MKRYVPMRKAENAQQVELVPVSEEVYAAITGESSRIRNKMQHHGRCVCPKKYLWKCDGDCSLCEFSAAGDTLSLDYEVELQGEQFPESLAITDQIMMRLILERLDELLPVAITVGEMKLDEELSERQCLEQLNLKRSTYRSQLEKARKQLEEEFGIKI